LHSFERLKAIDHELHQLEAELTHSEAKFKAVFNVVPDGLIVIDDQGKIEDVNLMTQKMFGYSHDELVGQAVEILVPDMSLKCRSNMEVLKKDGTKLSVNVALSAMKVNGFSGVVALIRDLSI